MTYAPYRVALSTVFRKERFVKPRLTAAAPFNYNHQFTCCASATL